MKTTADYIDELREKFGVDSDFSAMSKLGVKHRQQVSQWRQHHGAFGEELSLKVAEELEIDPAEVLLAMEIQREKNEAVRNVWERIAERMYAPAIVCGVVVLLNYLGAVHSDGLMMVAATSSASAGGLVDGLRNGALYIM